MIQMKKVCLKKSDKEKEKNKCYYSFLQTTSLTMRKKYSPHPGKTQFRHAKNVHLTFPPCST